MNTIDAYARRRQIDFALSLKGRIKIYLDTRFWIILREMESDPACELLALLRQGVAERRLVCPISASIFLEVMKQAHTPTRRIGTASLIDELSLGASFTTSDLRIGTEIGRFLYQHQGETALHDMDELIWTKLAYVLGYLHPDNRNVDAATNFMIQKGVFDKMWDTSLSTMVAEIGDAPQPESDFVEAAATISADIATHAPDIRTYKQLYLDEIAGAVDMSRHLAADAMCGMAETAGVTPPEKGTPEWEEGGRLVGNLIISAFTHRSATREELRTIHVMASLHAGLRWNRGRKFKPNDFYDFEHAAGALAYCHAFFTEGPLRDLVTAGNTRLHELNGCRVTAEIEEAIEITRDLLRSVG